MKGLRSASLEQRHGDVHLCARRVTEAGCAAVLVGVESTNNEYCNSWATKSLIAQQTRRNRK